MILYLCRHGSAEEAGTGGRAGDARRALTDEGAEKFRRAAKGFSQLEPDVTHILTSPLRRAEQTAVILRDVLGKSRAVPPRLIKTESLAPPGKLESLLAEIRAWPKAAGVVAVAHEPFLSDWIGQLCFGHAGSCELKKGAIAAIDLQADDARGTLLYLLQPGQLRALA